MTAEAPLIEVTASRIGANVSDQEIDTPAQPGPQSPLADAARARPGARTRRRVSSKAATSTSTAAATASNLWTVDGAANQDTDGGGTGPQARITLDSMAEFQVLTHQYTAEFGGSSGVIVNAVTKSGTNDFAGRGFYYFEDEKLRARDPFSRRQRAEAGERPQDVRLQRRRPDRPQQGVLLLQPRAQPDRERRRPHDAAGGGAAGRVLRRCDDHQGAEHVRAGRLHGRAAQLQLPLAARGRARRRRGLRVLPDARQPADRARFQRPDVQRRAGRGCSATAPPTSSGSRTSARTASTGTLRT